VSLSHWGGKGRGVWAPVWSMVACCWVKLWHIFQVKEKIRAWRNTREFILNRNTIICVSNDHVLTLLVPFPGASFLLGIDESSHYQSCSIRGQSFLMFVSQDSYFTTFINSLSDRPPICSADHNSNSSSEWNTYF